MQRWSRRRLEKWAGWLVLAVVLFLGAIFGRDQGQPPPRRLGADGPMPEIVKGSARLIDGDSLFVGSDEVRLLGIDAPEGRQTCSRDGGSWACGNAARDQLRRLIGPGPVECDVVERDKHGRLLARCRAGGRDLNAAMVATGMAVSYSNYPREEAEARAQRRGLWASQFERPRDWRRNHGLN